MTFFYLLCPGHPKSDENAREMKKQKKRNAKKTASKEEEEASGKRKRGERKQ